MSVCLSVCLQSKHTKQTHTTHTTHTTYASRSEKRKHSTRVCGLELLVYKATSACGLKLLAKKTHSTEGPFWYLATRDSCALPKSLLHPPLHQLLPPRHSSLPQTPPTNLRKCVFSSPCLPLLQQKPQRLYASLPPCCWVSQSNMNTALSYKCMRP